MNGLPPYAGSGSVTIASKGVKGSGGITLSDGTLVSSRSTDSTNNHDGGDISFFDLSKTARVDLGGAKLESGGQKLGANGDIQIVTGGTSDDVFGIIVAAVDTTNQTGGAQGSGGALKIVTAVPIIADGKTVTYNEKGALVGPGFLTAGKLTAGDVLFLNNPDLPQTDIITAGGVEVRAGRSVQITNTVTAPSVDLTGNSRIVTFTGFSAPSSGRIIADSAILTTGKGGFIGSRDENGDGLLIDTHDITVNSPGGASYIIGLGTGVIDVSSQGNAVLVVDATAQEIQGSATATSFIYLRGSILNPTGTFSSGDAMTLVSGAPLTNTDPTQYSAERIFLSSNEVGLGPANPFLLHSSVQEVGILSLGDAAVTANSPKNITIYSVAVVGDLLFRSGTGITLGETDQSVLQSLNGTSGLWH